MTDKIKLKADKFVNDKKLKLNYIKPKDLKLLLAEFCEEQIAELKAECDLAIDGRDVKIAELETRCNELFLQTCEQAEKIKELKEALKGKVCKCMIYFNFKDLEKENAELKGLVNQYKASKCGSISLVNRNMIMFDQLTKAKEIIKEFVEWANWQGNSKCPSFKSIQDKAEQFLSEVEK